MDDAHQAMPPASALRAMLEDARCGSVDRIEQLLEVYRPYLLSIANEELESDLRPKLGPSDLVQDTLFEAHRDFERSAFASEQELRGWLRKLLLNNLVDARRQFRDTQMRNIHRECSLSADDSRHLIESLIDPRDTSGGPRGISVDDIESFHAALARLRPEYTQLLVWHFGERRTFAEIGSVLGRSPDAIRMVCNRVVLRLRREMETKP